MSVRLGPEGKAGHICLYIATLAAVLGTIAGVANAFLGLELMSLFVLALAAFFTPFFIGMVISLCSKTTEAKKKE